LSRKKDWSSLFKIVVVAVAEEEEEEKEEAWKQKKVRQCKFIDIEMQAGRIPQT